VDILLELMVKEETPFSPSQIGHLFTFLARQLAKGEDEKQWGCLMFDWSKTFCPQSRTGNYPKSDLLFSLKAQIH
jgi:hypothetical protein